MTDNLETSKEYPAPSLIFFKILEQFFRGNHAASYLVCRGDYADAVRACFGF